MGLPEILVEHKKSEKNRKVVRVRPERRLFVIGSSVHADLRLNGDGVEGCHAALRFRAPHWYVCDLSGGDNVKVDGQIATEAKLDGSAVIEIGKHRLQLVTRDRSPELFKKEEPATGTALELHQVVVRARGRVVETELLPASKSFTYHDGEKAITLQPPKDHSWVSSNHGHRVIQQRLVTSQEILGNEKVSFDRDLYKPLALALVFFVLLLSGVFILGPQGEQKIEVVLDNKSLDIIYNAKVVKKKKVEAQKVVKTAKARAGATSNAANAPVALSSAPEESMAPKASDKPSVALTSLRQSGLANLVGKIAKRANKQGVLVAAQGVSADNSSAGRAFFSTGTSLNGGGSAAKAGPSFRLGGIATKGRAGGTGNFKEGTSLAGGNVGSGDLVAMVDEETVIEGGLDRDAIAEVIRRNLGQIRYCYERQLSSNPELYGKVLVKFTIGAAGEVTEPRVDTSTLKSAMVEGCIMRRMANWKFPEPKGGTQVKVSYPFLFKAN
jgi:TonB family protein